MGVGESGTPFHQNTVLLNPAYEAKNGINPNGDVGVLRPTPADIDGDYLDLVVGRRWQPPNITTTTTLL
ncbi:MAG: hypothetical protein H0A76_05695 [Candidatus Thiodubiliella endoseptemdiera]|uniref:Uncharacterized protein n=1 Tax=Candidatus Thiodubiliella endoseptemdiera TaxID=2738886 RepID=A0A853F368_9GAMM|nr:hypothetical protein [Candidatus Thiodubiliella endoseptemdiera]